MMIKTQANGGVDALVYASFLSLWCRFFTLFFLWVPFMVWQYWCFTVSVIFLDWINRDLRRNQEEP